MNEISRDGARTQKSQSEVGPRGGKENDRYMGRPSGRTLGEDDIEEKQGEDSHRTSEQIPR